MREKKGFVLLKICNKIIIIKIWYQSRTAKSIACNNQNHKKRTENWIEPPAC